MIIFAVFGGIIAILVAVLAWRDRRDRSQGAKISYQRENIFQYRLDTEVSDNPMFTRNRHDWMNHPDRDQPDEVPRA